MNEKFVEPKIAYSMRAAAQCSGLSRSTLYLLIRGGKLTARKNGKRTIIEDAELRRFIASLPKLGDEAA